MNSLWSTILFSFEVALAATLLTLLLGAPLAFAMARLRFPGKSLLESCIMIPMVLPPTVVGYLILMLVGGRGPIGIWLKQSFGYSIIFRPEGAILAAAIVALPMMYLPAKASFQGVDRELEDVARLLGASRWQMFWHVSLPLARRGLLAGLVLAFARALGEFGATVMILGWQSKYITLPISVWGHFEDHEDLQALPAVAALSVLSLGMMLAYNHFARPGKN